MMERGRLRIDGGGEASKVEMMSGRHYDETNARIGEGGSCESNVIPSMSSGNCFMPLTTAGWEFCTYSNK